MKRALVLGGGGSKGAYEIGVWKALRELNIKIDIVTGTSIGALIGCMVVQDDYDAALDLWTNIKVDSVMKNGLNLDMDIELIMSQKSKFKEVFSSLVANKGADITPLIQMIDRIFNPDKFFNSSIDYGCMSVKVNEFKGHPIIKSQMNPDNSRDFLLASASCFPAFPLKEIDGEFYADGGYYDNVPIHLAQLLGADEIIAVDLKSIGVKQEVIEKDRLIYISPFVPLGSFLNFDPELVKRNIDLGYYDTMRKYHKYLGYEYTFELSELDKLIKVEQTIKTNLLKETVGDTIDNIVHLERIFKEIETEFPNVLSLEHPYLRLYELLAEYLELEVLHIYTIEEFANSIVSKFEEHKLFCNIKWTELKSVISGFKNVSSVDIIGYIYHELMKTDSLMNVSHMLTLFKKEFILAIFLKLLHDYK
ncbi:MAG: patatin-like phospholipase family protein [Erysipelotrichaceae bacterium]